MYVQTVFSIVTKCRTCGGISKNLLKFTVCQSDMCGHLGESAGPRARAFSQCNDKIITLFDQ
jgi:hypothetical protein